jgi:YebC/PmpR family DNA-binding regulatory protein
MAGHSHFANIARRKDKADKARAKNFTKLAREIIAATKGGLPDPAANPRLRLAVSAARANNMTNDRINSAIKQGSGATGGENYEAIRYEGYGSGGVAIIVEALTDNRNRTAPELRSVFAKYGGNLGETNSVAFNFERVGLVEYPAEKASADSMLEVAIEAGADDCQSDDVVHSITCKTEDFNSVREVLVKRFGDAENAKLSWKAINNAPVVDIETAQSVMKLVEALEDLDDVQFVVTNADVSEEIMAKLR